MKIYPVILLAATCSHAAELSIPESNLTFTYDAAAWSPIGDRTIDLWVFTDPGLDLSGAIMRIDTGLTTKLSTEQITDLIGSGYEVLPSVREDGTEVFVFRQTDGQNQKWVRYVGAGTTAYFVYVEGEATHINKRRALVLKFLTGLSEK